MREAPGQEGLFRRDEPVHVASTATALERMNYIDTTIFPTESERVLKVKSFQGSREAEIKGAFIYSDRTIEEVWNPSKKA